MFKKFNDMLIRTKVITAFGIVLVLTAGIGVFSVQRLGAVNDNAADIRDNWMPSIVALGELGRDTIRYRQIEAAAMLAPTPELK